MIAHNTATGCRRLRAGCSTRSRPSVPAWFGAERTGGVMLSMVDGVEQLQTFFGQYLPQVAIAICAPLAIFFFIAWWDLPVAAVMLARRCSRWSCPRPCSARPARPRADASAFKSFGEEFLDAVQGLPTLKAFGQSKALRRDAGRQGARVVGQHVLGAGAECADPRLHRSRHRGGRGGGVGAGRLAGQHGDMSARGAADRADGRHRDFPPAARPAHGAARRA
jgi:hypothetical protein